MRSANIRANLSRIGACVKYDCITTTGAPALYIWAFGQTDKGENNSNKPYNLRTRSDTYCTTVNRTDMFNCTLSCAFVAHSLSLYLSLMWHTHLWSHGLTILCHVMLLCVLHWFQSMVVRLRFQLQCIFCALGIRSRTRASAGRETFTNEIASCTHNASCVHPKHGMTMARARTTWKRNLVRVYGIVEIFVFVFSPIMQKPVHLGIGHAIECGFC